MRQLAIFGVLAAALAIVGCDAQQGGRDADTGLPHTTNRPVMDDDPATPDPANGTDSPAVDQPKTDQPGAEGADTAPATPAPSGQPTNASGQPGAADRSNATGQ